MRVDYLVMFVIFAPLILGVLAVGLNIVGAVFGALFGLGRKRGAL